MLDFDTTIARQAELTRDRRYNIAAYKAASWFNPTLKGRLFLKAYPAAVWPVDELLIVAALLSSIGMVGLLIY